MSTDLKVSLFAAVGVDAVTRRRSRRAPPYDGIIGRKPMSPLRTGRRRRWYIITAAVLAVALAGGGLTWRLIEAHEAEERAELAAELAGEGIPPALAKHLADTIPENKIEGMEGPTSAAEEHFQALAYPDSDVSLTKSASARQAFGRLFGRGPGKGPKIPGVWTSLGPSKAVYPAFLNRHSSEYVTSGRVTALALDPDCTQVRCTLWLGAAGGGVWRTDKALAGNANWVQVSDSLPTNTVGSLFYDAARKTLYVGTGEANASGDSGAGQGVWKSTDGGNHWTALGGNAVFVGRAASSVTVDPANANTIYVSTTRSVRGVSSVTGGGTSLIPGAAKWGLYKSTDGGATFTFIHNGAADVSGCTGDAIEASGAGPCSPRGVRSFAIDPTDHTTLYAGSYSRGVWRSSDAGATWTQIKTPLVAGANTTSRPMFAVTALPNGDTRMYLGEGSAGTPKAQVWRSDSVRTGTPAFTTLTSTDPADRGYATTEYCTAQCWYDNFVVSPPGHPDIVYVGGSYVYAEDHQISNARAVVLSRDAGATWSDLTEDATSPTAPNGLHPDQHALVANPANPLQVWEGSDGGVMRTDGTLSDTSARCDTRNLSGAALRQCKWLLAAVPTSWTSLNTGLTTLQFQSLTVNPADGKDIQGGTQDNGTFETTGSSAVWPQTIFGDGGQSGFDASNAAFRVHTYYNASPDVNFTSGNPADWAWIGDPIYGTEPQAFYVPIITDPVVSGTMFVGTGHVWRTTTFGRGSMTPAEFQGHCNEFTGDFAVTCGDWQPLGAAGAAGQLINVAWGDRAGGTVAATERAAGDRSTLWAATSTGRVFVSRNADAANAADVAFTRIDPLAGTDPNRFVTGIAVDPANPLHAWISYSGYDQSTPSTPGHLFSVAYDPVAGTATWTSLDGDSSRFGLGNLPINDVAYDSLTADLFVSTDFGVLRQSVLLPGTWFVAGLGLPNVEVSGITIDVRNRQLIAATHGRGAYRLQLL